MKTLENLFVAIAVVWSLFIIACMIASCTHKPFKAKITVCKVSNTKLDMNREYSINDWQLDK